MVTVLIHRISHTYPEPIGQRWVVIVKNGTLPLIPVPLKFATVKMIIAMVKWTRAS